MNFLDRNELLEKAREVGVDADLAEAVVDFVVTSNIIYAAVDEAKSFNDVICKNIKSFGKITFSFTEL